MTTEINKLNKLVSNGDLETWSDFNGDCTRLVYKFDNGFGASVICNPHSYGGMHGLLELAVTWEGELCYDTHITSDVLGHLNHQEAAFIIVRIRNLPKRG